MSDLYACAMPFLYKSRFEHGQYALYYTAIAHRCGHLCVCVTLTSHIECACLCRLQCIMANEGGGQQAVQR